MTGLWIILGIFLFFFILFSIPVHVTIGLKESFSVTIRILFWRIPILPKPKSVKKKSKNKKKSDEKKQKDKKEKQEKKSSKKEKVKEDEKSTNGEKEAHKKKKPDIVFLLRLILHVVAVLFKKLGKHFKIRVLAYEICVATEEAAKTAVMYGMVQSLSETIFLRLEKAINFKIAKKAPIGVYANFLEEKTKANVEIDFSLSIADVFAIVFGVILASIQSFISSPHLHHHHH